MNMGSPPLPLSPFISQPVSLLNQLVRVTLVSQAVYEVNTRLPHLTLSPFLRRPLSILCELVCGMNRRSLF